MIFFCPCCNQAIAGRPEPDRIVKNLPLGPVQKRIGLELAASFGEWMPSAQLIERVYAGCVDGGPIEAQQVMSVSVIKTRRHLVGSGLRIDGKQWSGYRMAWTS